MIVSPAEQISHIHLLFFMSSTIYLAIKKYQALIWRSSLLKCMFETRKDLCNTLQIYHCVSIHVFVPSLTSWFITYFFLFYNPNFCLSVERRFWWRILLSWLYKTMSLNGFFLSTNVSGIIFWFLKLCVFNPWNLFFGQ